MFGIFFEEFLQFLEWASWCTVNDYEAHLLSERTGLSLEGIASRVEGLVVTRGGDGSCVYAGGQVKQVPVAPAGELADPTGCGDAYRGGLLYGLAERWPLEKACRLASVLGAFKIEARGPQNYTPNREEIAARYAATYGEALF